MSDVINDDDPGGFAAEYVLGTLDASERTRTAAARQRPQLHRHGENMGAPVGRTPFDGRAGRAGCFALAADLDRGYNLPGPGASRASAGRSREARFRAGPARIRRRTGPAAALTTDLVPEPRSLRVVAGDAPPPIAPTPASVEIAPAVAPMAPDQQLPEVAASPAEITLISSAQTVPSQPELVAVAAATEELKALARPLEPTVVMPTADRRPVPADRAPRALRHWRAFAILMMLLAFGFAGLIAAWRYAPDRLPPQLRPLEVLHMQPSAPAAAARRPAPPGSQFDE